MSADWDTTNIREGIREMLCEYDGNRFCWIDISTVAQMATDLIESLAELDDEIYYRVER